MRAVAKWVGLSAGTAHERGVRAERFKKKY